MWRASGQRATMSPEEVLSQLAIQRCDGLTDAHRKEIENAGYDIERIPREGGISAERLYDAAFLTEEIARTTLQGGGSPVATYFRNRSFGYGSLINQYFG